MQTIWRRIDHPGHEWLQVSDASTFHQLEGAAVGVYEQLPTRLDYRIRTGPDWKTESARVSGWVGDRRIELDIQVEGDRWRMNGVEQPQVVGCVDIDLNYSPSTNLLPVRRLNLAVGQSAVVKAAWLHFPDFELRPLEQVYRCIDPLLYRYESGGGSFSAEVRFNEAGALVEYGGYWIAEPAG
jgi:hypothetical protein